MSLNPVKYYVSLHHTVVVNPILEPNCRSQQSNPNMIIILGTVSLCCGISQASCRKGKMLLP